MDESDLKIGSALGDLANVSHQKGDIPLITISKDRLESITSPVSSLSSNFFTLMIGTALTIYMALRSGGVEETWRATFWLAFYFSLALVIFFGILTAAQEYRKYQLRREFKSKPPREVH